MNSLPKIFCSTAFVASAVTFFLFTSSAMLAQETPKETRVALRSAGGKYLAAATGGGFDLNSQSITDKTIFSMIDFNGGNLVDGDEVKIKYTPGPTSDAGKVRPSFWTEDAGRIKRLNAEPQKNTGTFKLKKQGAGFVLQTASGKFIAGLDDGGLTLADTPTSVLVFTIEEQPTAR